MRRLQLALAGLGLLPMLATPGQSQIQTSQDTPVVRLGLWFGVGAGGGWSAVTCDICVGDRDLDLSGYVRLGTTLSHRVLLGVEGNGWRHRNVDEDGNGVTNLFGSVQAIGYWYPGRADRPYFLKAGFGMVLFRADDDDEEGSEDDAITSSSFGGQFGVGYDLHISPRISFTPFANLIASLDADLELQDGGRVPVGLTLFQFGLGFTFH